MCAKVTSGGPLFHFALPLVWDFGPEFIAIGIGIGNCTIGRIALMGTLEKKLSLFLRPFMSVGDTVQYIEQRKIETASTEKRTLPSTSYDRTRLQADEGCINWLMASSRARKVSNMPIYPVVGVSQSQLHAAATEPIHL